MTLIRRSCSGKALCGRSQEEVHSGMQTLLWLKNRSFTATRPLFCRIFYCLYDNIEKYGLCDYGKELSFDSAVRMGNVKRLSHLLSFKSIDGCKKKKKLHPHTVGVFSLVTNASTWVMSLFTAAMSSRHVSSRYYECLENRKWQPVALFLPCHLPWPMWSTFEISAIQLMLWRLMRPCAQGGGQVKVQSG